MERATSASNVGAQIGLDQRDRRRDAQQVLSAILARARIAPADLNGAAAWPADREAISANCRLLVLPNADTSQVAAIVSDFTGRAINRPIAHLRIVSPAMDKIGAIIIHRGVSDDVEVVPMLVPGMISRSLIRGVARWIFRGMGFNRIVLRLQAGEVDACSYAGRIGFRPEGGDKWVMLKSECAWLQGCSTHEN